MPSIVCDNFEFCHISHDIIVEIVDVLEKNNNHE